MSGSTSALSPARVARTVIVALLLVALAWLLWAARDLVFILFFGVLVALFISVFVDVLLRAGVPRMPAVLVVVAALAALLALLAWGLWPIVQEQLVVVAQDVPRVAGQLGEWLQRQYQAIRAAGGGAAAEEVEQELRARLADQASALVGGALPVLNSALGALAGFLVVVMSGIYIATDPRLYRDGFMRLLPPRHRPRVAAALAESAVTLRRWMVGTLISMLIVGGLVAAGLWLLDVPAAIALAVIAAMLEFVPIIGPILAAIPAIAVAFTVSPVTGLWVVLLYTVIQQLEGNVITPLVMRGAVRLPPALTLLFQSFMAIVFGFLGLLLAVPILAAVVVVVRVLYIEPLESRDQAVVRAPAGSG